MKHLEIITICLIFMALCAGLIHLSTDSNDFSKYNIGWNGTFKFFALPDRHSTFEVRDPPSESENFRSTILIIAPKTEFSSDQIKKYQNYIAAGNTILLADDFGKGNSLLRGIGSHISILPGILCSVDRTYNNSYSVATYPVDATHPLLSRVDSLFLNKATTLLGGEPLVTSSLFSWVDKDKDNKISKKEILGKYTVVAREKLGDGEIIVLTDPSIFINSMQNPGKKFDNEVFINNILSLNPVLNIDQSNSKTSDYCGMCWIIDIIRSVPALKIMYTAIILLLLTLIHLRTEEIKNDNT